MNPAHPVLSSTVAALAAFLGLHDLRPATVLAGDVAASVSVGVMPGEIRARSLTFVRGEFGAAMRRLRDPRLQPGALGGGFIDPDSPDSVADFIREARLDEGDPGRLRGCGAGRCRVKVTRRAAATLAGLRAATDDVRRRAYLADVASLAPCALRDCDEVLVDGARSTPLRPIARRLATEASFDRLFDAIAPAGPVLCEWRVESYWKREVVTLSRVEIFDGRLHGRRAALHRRSSVFSTHYIHGLRAETLLVEGDAGVVVAMRQTVQTDKASGFNAFERALIRGLGGRRIESQARQWPS
jgi:hypothetical protein